MVSAVFLVGVPLLEQGNSSVPFDYYLAANQTSGSVLQGQSIQTNLGLVYIQGDPENVTLYAVGGPENTTYTFSTGSGAPTENNTFESVLKVSVPPSAALGSYQLNITSIARNGKTCTVPYKLNVLSANINVSGAVTADFNQDIYPIKITFVSTSTNQSYSTNVSTTPSSEVKSPTGWLVQTGRYSLFLPNHQSYTVVCSWIRLPGPWNPQGEEAAGTFSGGVISVNFGEGVAFFEDVNFSD